MIPQDRPVYLVSLNNVYFGASYRQSELASSLHDRHTQRPFSFLEMRYETLETLAKTQAEETDREGRLNMNHQHTIILDAQKAVESLKSGKPFFYDMQFFSAGLSDREFSEAIKRSRNRSFQASTLNR